MILVVRFDITERLGESLILSITSRCFYVIQGLAQRRRFVVLFIRAPVEIPDRPRIVPVDQSDDVVPPFLAGVTLLRDTTQLIRLRIIGLVHREIRVDAFVTIYVLEDAVLARDAQAALAGPPRADQTLDVPLVEVQEEPHERAFIVGVASRRIGLDNDA